MRGLILIAVLGGLAACSDPSGSRGQAQQGQKEPRAPEVAPASGQPPAVAQGARSVGPLDRSLPGAEQIPGDTQPYAQATAEPATTAPAEPSADLPPLARVINGAEPGSQAQGSADEWPVAGVDPVLVRVEVLLDRAGFSPGVIDGRDGQNLRRAAAAYAEAHALGSGEVRGAVWQSLTSDAAPVVQLYTLTAQDVAGPFIGERPKDYEALARLPRLDYSNPLQALAERFHMDERLLQALNPGVDFSQAGAAIIVASPRQGPRPLEVARIEVDKSNASVRAYDSSDKLVAFYPASVGSSERPAPSGAFQVKAVAPHPAYYYDPQRLTFTPEGARGKLRIAPGPNNPVGETWIALSVPTYGIHGSPEPATIGKRQSHGCVRLTNWDAVELGKAVKKGVPVVFVGSEAAARA